MSFITLLDGAYTGTPTKQFTADAVIGRTLIFEDTFTRTLTEELGDPDLGVLAEEMTFGGGEEQWGVDGSTLYAGPADFSEIDFIFGPISEVGHLTVDIQAQPDMLHGFRTHEYQVGSGTFSWYAAEIQIVHDIDHSPEQYLWGSQEVGFDNNLPFPLVDGDWYSIKFDWDLPHRTARWKIWPQGDPEPIAWDRQWGLAARTFISFYEQADYYIGWLAYGDVGSTHRLDNLRIYSEGLHTVGIFNADAVITKTVSTTFTADSVLFGPYVEATFTADAYLVKDVRLGDFTANAILKKTTAVTYTANAYLVKGLTATFTADAFLLSQPSVTFTANAIIHRAHANQFQRPGHISKVVNLTILQHREKPLPVFVPPKAPDTGDEDPDNLGGPNCLSPCLGAGAGYGTGYGANGGAIVRSITHCTSASCPETYFNNGDTYIGKGPIGSTTHCDCSTSHSQFGHVNRTFITYSIMPEGKFRMRAKMVWDIGAPEGLTVQVYAGATAPDLEVDECDSSAPYWNSGILVGNLGFSADSSGTIGERSVWFQKNPSEIVLDPGAFGGGGTFRFALTDEGTYYAAEFKAANVEIVTD